jgi:hypothetical protein
VHVVMNDCAWCDAAVNYTHTPPHFLPVHVHFFIDFLFSLRIAKSYPITILQYTYKIEVPNTCKH